MDIDINKALAEFELKLKGTTAAPLPPKKPVHKAAQTLAPEPAPAPSQVQQGIAQPPGACFTESFKVLVASLAEEYIGENEAKLWLLSQPDCPVKAG